MSAQRSRYINQRLGFVEIPPYNNTYLPGTRFHGLKLAA
jgi:hypothetical protein